MAIATSSMSLIMKSKVVEAPTNYEIQLRIKLECENMEIAEFFKYIIELLMMF